MHRYFVALAITVLTGLSLHVRKAVADTPDESLLARKSRVIAFEDCQSGSLRLELNHHDRASKADLVEQLKILGDYPQLHFSPERSAGSSVIFLASLDAQCLTKECAQEAGWTKLQKRLLQRAGVSILCELPSEQQQQPAPGGAQSPEAPKQEAPKPGGVTGGSGGE